MPLAIVLLAGSLLLLVCSALHPILPLTGQGDLAMITAMPSWRVIHLGLLYATGMIIAGIWARVLAADPAERIGLGAACVVLSIGEALNGVNIGFMAGAGTEFARLFAAGADVSRGLRGRASRGGDVGRWRDSGVALGGAAGDGHGTIPGEPALAGGTRVAGVRGGAGGNLRRHRATTDATSVGVMGCGDRDRGEVGATVERSGFRVPSSAFQAEAPVGAHSSAGRG
jgi:hypothetical protein